MGNNLCIHEASTFLHLHKKIRYDPIKINFVGPYPKFPMFLLGTIVL